MPDDGKFIRIIGDQPWSKEGVPEFHFKEYGATLAEIPLNPKNETPLCVLVQGEWGVGKSTLMETVRGILEKELDKKEPGKRVVKSVWFNAWKYKDAAPVMAGLLGALLQEIGKAGLWAEFQEFFLKYRGRLAKAIIYAFPAFLDKFISNKEISKQLADCSTNIDKVLSKCDEIDLFQQAFLEVASAWLMNEWVDTTAGRIDDENFCLAVYIDDLDRCDPDQIKAVLEAVKLFLDFPGVCFYLAMDQHQLDRYLKDIFKERSKDALDKFVQVIFNIPPPPTEDFQGYVEGLLAGHPLHEYIHSQDRQVLAVNLPPNPRSAKRYLNDLAIWFSVFGKINKGIAEDARRSLMPYAGRYHLLAHAIQKRDRAKWNAKAGSAQVLLTWLQSLKEKSEGELEGKEEDFDFRLAKSNQLMDIVNWMLEPENHPEENLKLIVEFRRRLAEPESPAAKGGKIDPLTMISIPGKKYEMGAYPVTQRLYYETMGENPSYFKGEGKETDDHPVEKVSFFDAVKFCNKLSKKKRLFPAYKIEEDIVTRIEESDGFRLPTEVEWEYACKAGSDKDPYGPLDEIAWYDANSDDSTHPVGKKKPNSWGLYDMLGNVYEWCFDWYDEDKKYRVVGGGAWGTLAMYVRASNCLRDVPDERDGGIGFRISRDLK